MTELAGRPIRTSWSPQAQYVSLGMKIFRLRQKLDALEEQNMAKITWRGETFLAKPIRQNPDGSWVMEALQHSGRTVPGTRITVLASEIVKGTMDEAPAESNSGQAALDAGMAQERKTLPTPAELIAQAQGKSQGDTGAVPPGPTPAPVVAPNSQTRGIGLMSTEAQTAQRAAIERVKAKLKRAAGVLPEVMHHLEANADLIVQKGDDVMNRSDKVCAPHVAMLHETDAGLDDLDAALQVMGNGGPPLSSGGSSPQ